MDVFAWKNRNNHTFSTPRKVKARGFFNLLRKELSTEVKKKKRKLKKFIVLSDSSEDFDADQVLEDESSDVNNAPELTSAECHSLLRDRETEETCLKYENSYLSWYRTLRTGFSLLFYGFGAKGALVESFMSKMCTDGPVVVIDGSISHMNPMRILASLRSSLESHTLWNKSPSFVTQCDHIERMLRRVEQQRVFQKRSAAGSILDAFTSRNISDSDEEEERSIIRLPFCRVYVCVLNIDGDGMRSAESQRLLGYMAMKDHFHLIATVNHSNSPMLWDSGISARFHWYWIHTPTFSSYLNAVQNSSSTISLNEKRKEEGAQHVLRALTQNQKEVFKLLAKYQLAKTSRFLSFHELYRKCRRRFIVTAENILRSYLNELRDHELLEYKRKSDGVERIFISIGDAVLRKLLEDI